MKVWFVSFIILFLFAQFILWVKNFFTPIPLYILGGAFLAMASNYDQKINDFIRYKTNNILSPSGKKLNE